MINRGTFGSRWGGLGDFPPTTTGVETSTDGEEVEDGVDGTDGEVEDGEIGEDIDLPELPEEPEEEEELDEETQSTLNLINTLRDQVGFEIDEEDLETYGSDLKAIYEGKSLKKAEDLLQSYIGSLSAKESDVVGKLLRGMSLEDVLEIEKDFPTYSEEAILADPELQKKIIIENEKFRGRTDKQIATYLKGLGEDLSEDAIEAATELKAKREARIEAKQKAAETARQEAAARNKAIAQSSNEYVDKLTEFVPGVKLTTPAKAAVKAKFATTMEKINGDLGKYIPLLSLLDHYGFLDGNFEAVKSVKVTSANAALTKAIKAGSQKTKPNPYKR